MKRERVITGILILILVLGANFAFGAPVTVNGDLEVADEPDSGVPAAVVFGDGTRQTTASSGTVTSVGTGHGLTGGPITKTGTLSVNTTVIQNRVTGACALGSFFGAINADGSVVCQSGSSTGGTVTQVNSGAGLTGGPITTMGTLSVLFGGTGSATTAAKSDHTHNYDATYVNVTGDTMTGPLTLPANGLAAGTTQFVLSGGNVGIGTASPAQKLEVSGNVKISGAGNGVSFSDGTSQTTAVTGGGGGVPSGFMILGETASPPAGYTYTGKSLGMPGSWAAKSNMPTARNNPAAAVVNNRVYVIGGVNGSADLQTNEEYDPVTNTWATKTNMPTARERVRAAVVNDKIYVIGGLNGSTALQANEEYNPTTNSWTTRTSMPTARENLIAAAVNNKIYAIGGYNGAALTTNEEYDPATNAWAGKKPMPTARGCLASAVVNNRIYSIGGDNGSALTTNEEYNPVTDTWTGRAGMSIARACLAAAAVNNRIYAIGGGAGGVLLSTNEEYDPVTDTWVNRAIMPTARWGNAGAAVNNKVYVLGGTLSPSSVGPWPGLTANEEFTPEFLYVHKKN